MTGRGGEHPELTLWAANVGGPVALDGAPPARTPLRGLTVVSWNVAIGRADLAGLLDRLEGGAFDELLDRPAIDPARPLVLLLQEAYRASADVPALAVSGHHGGEDPGPRPGRTDVVRLAEARGLALRYAPSMRNGRHPSDRGNAVLAAVPLGPLRPILLPLVRQRRVAVACALADAPRVHLCSAHLDTRGQPRRRHGPPRWLGPFGAGRAAQASALAAAVHGSDASAAPLGATPDFTPSPRRADAARAPALLLGADLNSYLGAWDPALDPLKGAGLRQATRLRRWFHTYHRAGLRLPLDHLLWAPGDGAVQSVRVVRLDERPGDRGARVFGSDHHPLLADVGFA